MDRLITTGHHFLKLCLFYLYVSHFLLPFANVLVV